TYYYFFFQAEDGIRDRNVTGVQTCALPIFAERARLEGSLQISHEWIYAYIYADKRLGGELHRHLRCQKRRRKRYGSGRQRRGQRSEERRVGKECRTGWSTAQ